MLRPVLPIAAFTLVAAASLSCVDREVPSNGSKVIQKFTGSEGQLLFFPDQGFDGVTIDFVVHDSIAKNISSEDLCVNGSRWYRLKVTVTWRSDWWQYCKYQVDGCSGSCGLVNDAYINDYESVSVIARGASFWSVDNTHQEGQCSSPVSTTPIPFDATDGPTTDAPDGPTPPATSSHDSNKLLGQWLVGVGSGVLVVAVVVVGVALACMVRISRRGYVPK